MSSLLHVHFWAGCGLAGSHERAAEASKSKQQPAAPAAGPRACSQNQELCCSPLTAGKCCLCFPPDCPEGDQPQAKKAKKEEGKAAAAAAAPAAAAPTPATGGASSEWSKKQGQDLVKLVEDEDERKKVGSQCAWYCGFCRGTPETGKQAGAQRMCLAGGQQIRCSQRRLAD